MVAAPLPLRADVLQERSQRFQPKWSPAGMVASQEHQASHVGAGILQQGGNAVDAAVATAFALAVTLPQAGNLGGGGFAVLWLPGPSPAAPRGCLPAEARAAGSPEVRLGGGVAVAVNFRETAPQGASAGMFLRPDGTVDRSLATRSPLSVAVPGTPAGLLLQRCYGCLPRSAVLAPAIRLAREGFRVGKELADSLAQAAPLLQRDPTSSALFLLRPLRPGDRWRQPLLAAALGRIAAQGGSGFYQGPIADALVTLMRQRGGLIRHGDLNAYRAQLVRPLQARFLSHPVLTMPPPSGGGVTLVQLLQILEPMPLASLGLNSAAAIHRHVEAMNLAYRDRNQWLGDPDQVAMPLERLLSQAYTDRLRAQICSDRHRPAAELAAEATAGGGSGGTNTTHLSVVDGQGGAGGADHHAQLCLWQWHQRPGLGLSA
ncbi:MAG: gamma-glutamyltransferase [Cyanobacteriota bacterium]|nr:gamma-glutamyltransferase [Cyanobacteriota bacterium]